MGISVAIYETECKSALCRSNKENVLRVLVKDPSKYGDAAEYERFLPIEDALKVFPDKDGFMKRNKIKEDVCTIYLDRLKDKEDRAALEKVTERTYTGWIEISKLTDNVGKGLITVSAPYDRQTEWDMLSFEEMNSVCAECKLSWDKGRGCIGSFGPDNSALPEIALKHGCKVTGSIPAGVAASRKYTKNDASELLKEIPILRNALETEGKLALKRYTGPVDRLEAVALISIEEGCGFRFF
ncbi:MAG: hypothetical protein LBE48_02330 [Methanomassiliicoccaceae archaeon]|jgi:hypothetical protein|nr:hypothetical protein [Methanomassiliicoccaceae archaeon]